MACALPDADSGLRRQLSRFGLLGRGCSEYLMGRCGERKENASALESTQVRHAEIFGEKEERET
jgi:hypothetical protein